MRHMIEKVYDFIITYANDTTHFPNLGSVQTVKYSYDVYTNDCLHSLFPQSVYTQQLFNGGYLY